MNLVQVIILALFILNIIVLIYKIYKTSKPEDEEDYYDHDHNYVLIAKTYKANDISADFETTRFGAMEAYLDYKKETTSFLFQCSDPKCGDTYVEVLDGKEVLLKDTK